MSTESVAIQIRNASIANSSIIDPSDEAYCNSTVLRARIDAAAQAQKRSRAAFLVSTIISLAILIAMWNAYLSWYRSFFWKSELATVGTTTEVAQKALIDEWVKSLKFSIPVLGIEAGVGDGAVVGSLSLYIVCVWVFVSMRRENHIIGDILKETKRCPDDTRIGIFHGIVSFSVFTIISTTDEAISDLDKEPQVQPVKWVRWSYKALIMLPAFTIISLFTMDILSIVLLKSPFRGTNLALWHNLQPTHWVKRAFMELVCFGLFVPTLNLCLRIINYDNSTERILKQYQSRLPQIKNSANESG